MDLYERNYKMLTSDEEEEIEKINAEINTRPGEFKIKSSLYSKYPKAYRFNSSYFPNNFLDPAELHENKKLNIQVDDFSNSLTSEREILNSIRNNKTYFIIGSLFGLFNFGHHSAYLFPEFELGTSFKSDYLLIGEGSGGHYFVFVELEAPTGDITLADGNFGQVFRKGIAQIKEWESWLEANFGNLKETFNKFKNNKTSLPNEFYSFDRSRINYIVIAGRRTDFSEKTYREKELERRNSLFILHYDNLIDSARDIIDRPAY